MKLNTNTKKLVLAGMFIALSFVGSLIKVPGSTIAFDSMAGFVAALFLGPLIGGAVGAIGHFLTALTSGFPLTLPIHIIIAFSMFVTMFVFGLLYKKLKDLSIPKIIVFIIITIVGIFFNSILSTLLIEPLLKLPPAEIISLIVTLAIVSSLNIIMAIVIYSSLIKIKALKKWIQ